MYRHPSFKHCAQEISLLLFLRCSFPTLFACFTKSDRQPIRVASIVVVDITVAVVPIAKVVVVAKVGRFSAIYLYQPFFVTFHDAFYQFFANRYLLAPNKPFLIVQFIRINH